MSRNLLGLGVLALSVVGSLGLGVSSARAQVPGESVVYETVPGTRSVTYGERTIVKHKFNKTVIKERPVRYVTTTPPVVRATRVIQAPPVVEEQIVQPPPVIESRVVQPPPIVESRVIQPAPVIQQRVIRSQPVYQTRYLAPY